MAKKNKTADPGPKKETFEGRKDAGTTLGAVRRPDIGRIKNRKPVFGLV